MIKRLSCLIILCFVSFYVGSMVAPKTNLHQVQKENMFVQQESLEEKKDHNVIVIGHISGQYQHIYKQKKK